MKKTSPLSLVASAQRHAELEHFVPRGYTSAARMRKNQVMFERGLGGRLVDLDGNEFVDCTLALGPIVIGHAEPAVQARIHRQVDQLLVGGAESPDTADLARRFVEWIPCAEQVVFANTGSEAVHLALRIARATTGRRKILRFEGHYHGWLDPMYTNGMAHGPSEALPSAIPVRPNGPGQMRLDDELVVARWNDKQAIDAVIEHHGGEIAAVIMEPIAFNAGGLVPYDGYLEHVRELCSQHGILLIFDEVVTGFRLARGGAQERFGVTPDLATFAKAAAGGVPIAVVAGTHAAMAPLREGRMSVLGTYTGNPLSITASLATLDFIAGTPDFYEQLDERAEYLARGMSAEIERAGVPIRLNRTGSIINPFWGAQGDLRTVESVASADFSRMQAIIDGMTLHGVYALPRGAFFVCFRHTQRDLDHVIAAWAAALDETLIEHGGM